MSALTDLYVGVPDVECKGLCHAICGAIPITDVEAANILANGHAVPYIRGTGGIHCSALTDGKRCSIYESRPLICRLYGAASDLRCPHGCRPARWLRSERAREMIKALHQIPLDSTTGM